MNGDRKREGFSHNWGGQQEEVKKRKLLISTLKRQSPHKCSWGNGQCVSYYLCVKVFECVMKELVITCCLSAPNGQCSVGHPIYCSFFRIYLSIYRSFVCSVGRSLWLSVEWLRPRVTSNNTIRTLTERKSDRGRERWRSINASIYSYSCYYTACLFCSRPLQSQDLNYNSKCH